MVAFSAFAGFQVSLLLNAKLKVSDLQPNDTPRPDFLTEADYGKQGVVLPDSAASRAAFLTYRDVYNPTLVSLVGGVGVDIRLTEKLRLHVHGRADYDIVDMEDKTLKPLDSASRFNLTAGLQVGLTYVFGKAEPIGKGEKKTKKSKNLETVTDMPAETEPASE
jgi:hypothetical protein